MSLREEQYRALLKTRDFLRDLLTTEKYPKTKKEMRMLVCSCLKHFPRLDFDGRPIFSTDLFFSESEKLEQEREKTPKEWCQ